jgi:hypothetical protein
MRRRSLQSCELSENCHLPYENCHLPMKDGGTQTGTKTLKETFVWELTRPVHPIGSPGP